MLLSRSVFRRYTPPTCTLQITAKISPLSRWSGGKVLQDFGFELHFDDPRLPEEKQVTIEGDRVQLNLLCDVVAEYIQNFLQQSPSSLALHYAPSLALPSSTSEPQQSHVFEQVNIQPGFLSSSLSTPDLKPKGLLNHELFFGSLATATSGELILLSTTQLWDLANALDEYSNEITAFPAFSRSSGVEASTIWAAAVLLVATGLTATGIRWYQLNQEASTIALQEKLQQPGELNQSPKISLVPLPPDTATPSPTLPPPLSSQQKLPPPPGVSTSQSPIRPQSQPLRVPAETALPPLPAPRSLPQGQTVTIVPQPPQPTAPARANTPDPNDVEALSPGFSPENAARFSLPKLPPLQSQPSNLNQSSSVESATARSQPQATSKSLLDTIPQVAEVRQYFQQRWKPPEGISQTLEYRLVLSQDGSLQRIMPLGQGAKIYLDRTGMPLLGESFVSPLEVAGNPKIRLMLGPDGTVKTFLEN